MTKDQATRLKFEIVQYGEAMAMGDQANADRARTNILAMLDDLTKAEPTAVGFDLSDGAVAYYGV